MKMNNKSWGKIGIFLILSSFLFLVYGLDTYYSGHHNVVLSFDAKEFEKIIDYDLEDRMSNGEIIDYNHLFILGMNQIKNGIWKISISNFVFYMGVGVIIFSYKVSSRREK